MNHPQKFAIRFQPTHLQHSQGSALWRDAITLDEVFYRPDVCAKWAREAHIVRPELKVWATIDKWLEYTLMEDSVNGGGVIVPDCPEGYNLTFDDSTPAVFNNKHGMLMPNHNHSNPLEIVRYILKRYLLSKIEGVRDHIHGLSHDWCQDDVHGVTGIDPGSDEAKKAVAFRHLLIEEMGKESVAVARNPGGASLHDEVPSDVIMEGTQLGGNLEQIHNAMSSYDLVYFSERLLSEEQLGGEVKPDKLDNGNTNNFRLIRSSICRCLTHNHPISISKGYGYESYGDYDELNVNLGKRVGQRVKDKITQTEFEHGTVFYHEGASDTDVIDTPSLYRLTGNQNPEINDGSQDMFLRGKAKSSMPHREIGDGLIMMKKSHVVVSDIIAGLDWMRSSPGQVPAYLEGNWEPLTTPDPKSPIMGSDYYATGPIYNNFVTGYGPDYNAHGEMVPVVGGNCRIKASFRVNVPGKYRVHTWSKGRWEPMIYLDMHEGNNTWKANYLATPGDYTNAIMLRYVDDQHVKYATKMNINGSDQLNGGTPIISAKDGFFGIELDGYMEPSQLKLTIGGKETTIHPIKLLYGEWGPRRETFHYIARFGHFDTSHMPGDVIKYIQVAMGMLPAVTVGIVP